MVLPGGNLTARVVVGAVLIVVAVAAVWLGGIAFTTLVFGATLLMFAEWSVLHGIARGFRLAGLAALAFVGMIALTQPALTAVVVLAAAAGLLGLFVRGVDRPRAFWIALGTLYCGLPMIALLWLRARPDGICGVTWVFAIVWATDIAAFFGGRAIGGARLAPAISPNKTVAGLVAGVIAGAAASAIVAVSFEMRFAAGAMPFAIALVGGGLAAVAQGGDLFESWLKRRAGVKDSGTLLPGHGGVLDRLDGLVPVAIVGAIIVAIALPQ